MSSQFIFSPHSFEAIAKSAGLTKTVSFNRVMLEHYEQLYTNCKLSWLHPRRVMLLGRVAMYRQALETAKVQAFLNEVNAQHHGPAITISN